ncbi:hypothetical protein [Peribacillus frigoritolerans]|uniref:hypothetical protein n=1 Tax=Peribacillus frigoritolerans TaxID=450367 RepID=UPI002EA99F3A|nr:hypothetical protein [Peribacillus frigoritolerans]
MHPISKLICGQTSDDLSDIKQISDRLNKTISNFSERLLALEIKDNDNRLLAPFYARSILEAACTALLLRLDPFRVLSIYKVQSTTQYDITKKSNVSLLWTGDILAANKPKDKLWHPENKLTDLDRALLSNYTGDLFWKQGFLKTLDYINNQDLGLGSNWLNDLKEFDENAFFERSKTESSKLYSAFSKGVHYEFLIEANSVYDFTTVQNYVNRMFQLIANLGLISHFIGTMSSRFEKNVSLNLYLEIEELIEEWSKITV